MRKYGKRCLCFLLALAMVLSNVSVGSVAYASELETVDSAKESEKDSTSSDVPEEETETDAEESENEDDDKSDESPADEKCCCPHELSLTCLHESSSDCLTFCHQSLQGCRLTTGGNKDYVVMVPSISCSTTYLII